MPSKLHTSTTALTHSLQDFLGRPRPLGPGMAILVIEFVHEDARATWPYHLRRLVLRATATSWIPNFVYRVSMGTCHVVWHRRSSGSWLYHFYEASVNAGLLGPKFHFHVIGMSGCKPLTLFHELKETHAWKSVLEVVHEFCFLQVDSQPSFLHILLPCLQLSDAFLKCICNHCKVISVQWLPGYTSAKLLWKSLKY